MPPARSHSNTILPDGDMGALFGWQVGKKGMCCNWMIILRDEVIMPFRARHKSEMILAIIIMSIHMVFTEVKPPKRLMDGRRCQLLPYKEVGLLELMIQERSL